MQAGRLSQNLKTYEHIIFVIICACFTLSHPCMLSLAPEFLHIFK